MEHVFDLPQRQGEADIHHHSKADNFGRRLEISEWIFHPGTLRDVLSALKQFCSDKAESSPGARVRSLYRLLGAENFIRPISVIFRILDVFTGGNQIMDPGQ